MPGEIPNNRISYSRFLRNYTFAQAARPSNQPESGDYWYTQPQGNQSQRNAYYDQEYIQRLERMQAMYLEHQRLYREDRLSQVASSVASAVYSLANYGEYYAKRNMLRTGLQHIFSSLSAINYGISTLSSSWGAGISNTFLSGISNRYRSLESAMNDAVFKTKGIAPTDTDLLRLTGLDRMGRTDLERRRALLAEMPLFNTPLRTLLSEDPQVFQGVNLPPDLNRFINRINPKNFNA